MDERLIKAIEGVLFRKGNAKMATIRVEASRMAELRNVFEELNVKRPLEVNQRWLPYSKNRKHLKQRTVLEFNEYRVGYSVVGEDGVTVTTSCDREQWDKWVKNTQAVCLEIDDYAR